MLQISWHLVGLVAGFAFAGVMGCFLVVELFELELFFFTSVVFFCSVVALEVVVTVFEAQIVKLLELVPQPQPPAAADDASQVAEREIIAARARSSMTHPLFSCQR